jgi:hypothetical protein
MDGKANEYSYIEKEESIMAFNKGRQWERTALYVEELSFC